MFILKKPKIKCRNRKRKLVFFALTQCCDFSIFQIPTVCGLTLKRPSFIRAHVPVAPDLAKMVRVGSDHSKKLTSVFYGAKNEKLTFKTIYIHIKFYKINFFFLIFFCVIFYLWCVTSRNDESLSFRFHNRLLI